MVGVWSRGVWNDRNIVRSCLSCHLQDFGHSSDPHDIRLQDVDVSSLDQLSEAVTGVLVFTSGPFHARVCSLQQLKAVKVVWVQNFLKPVDVQVLCGRGQLNGIWNSQRHVTVHHKREVGAHGLSVLSQKLDVFLESDVAFVWAVWKRNLSTPESHLLGSSWVASSAVEVDLLLCGSANQLVDGFSADLSQKIPKGQVNDRNHGDWQTFAAVEHGRTEHLVPQDVVVSWVGAFQESEEMVLHQPTCWRSTESGSKTFGSVSGLDLNTE
ncbi:conserved hypothetical protein [Clavispora lusitaniae ATCC 42720]|uniref:Uncharacterized protein n=1 Tax=Clavispora lusitaniae (strain ATCC 42720) TaxID=306902 RepID=C4Y309_CLAL4|nr:uncharacterized protein CLUG_02922 [Clavispora lusitaniae ATCC 42720]EEQ38795.1 conserved hypothetical protein [Clavispora lusitaniae ATCC 42720]